MGLHSSEMVEHYSANAEAIGSNPVEVPKFISGLFAIAKIACNYHCDDHVFI